MISGAPTLDFKGPSMKDEPHPWRRFFDGPALIVTVAVVVIAGGLIIALAMRASSTGF